MNLKDKTVCFIDHGLFVSFARHCAPAFKKAFYYNPWQSYAVRSHSLIVGTGFDEIECIKYLFHHIDEIDLFVFLDLYHSDLQCYLAEQGARVWGPRCGEELELHRWEFKEHLKRIGLPVQPCKQVIGIEELRNVLKEEKNKFIKASFTRGDMETFRHDSYELSEPHLDEIEHQLGPLKGNYEFVVESEIPNAIEVGYDGFTIDGQWPSHAMVAYEVKDVGMIGTAMMYKDLPAPVLTTNSILTPTLKGYGYRGFFCMEIRYGKDKRAYPIDPCARLGTPSNELLQVLFDGWPKTLWAGAVGNCVSPGVRKTYAVAAVIHSEHAVDGWQALHYPKEVDPFVKLRFHCRLDGVDYTVPQPVGNPYPGVVLGEGNTLDQAVAHCIDNAAKVKGFGIHVSLESINKALEVIKEGEKVGFKFGYKPIPANLRSA